MLTFIYNTICNNKFVKLNLKLFLTNQAWKEAFFINFYCPLKGIEIESWREVALKDILVKETAPWNSLSKSDLNKSKPNSVTHYFRLDLIKNILSTYNIKKLMDKMDKEFNNDVEFLSNHVIVVLSFSF